MTALIAEVFVDVRTRALDRTFDYLVPERLAGVIQPGHRVFVSFGHGWRQGFVWSLREAGESPPDLKEIGEVLDDEPLLTPPLMDVCAWLVQRYACTRVEAIEAVLPAAFRVESQRVFEAVGEGPVHPDLLDVWRDLQGAPKTLDVLVQRLGPGVKRRLEQLRELGAVREIAVAKDAVGERVQMVLTAIVPPEQLLAFADSRARRAPKQAALARRLAEERVCVLAEAGLRASDSAVQALVNAGLAQVERETAYRRPDAAAVLDGERPQLTSWQQRVLRQLVDALQRGDSVPIVLHGVTGSGKTEVYLQAIERCLDEGGGAIVLVPEIALTPQLVGRFQARFGDRVAVLHSGLSLGEKRDEWMRLRRGEARVAIGARSAVFAPVERLRLVVIDEEHEPAYKQEDAPRYDAREVALWRARREGGLVVLGSATPSLQAMHWTETGHARLAVLPMRVNGRPLPPVEVVDMREELRAGERGLLSRALRAGLEEAVGSGHQAILFLNRRGLAAFTLCRACGHVPSCPHCDISLTLHREARQDVLVCHYCQFRMAASTACPACGEPAMRPFGIGTQQLEDVVRTTWPKLRVLRMDVDTTRRKGAHQAAIRAVLEGHVDVLIGTQMIAKGLDFPNVSFVGVVSADTMLAVPDFRAAERTFSLLTQVAGRAGRAGVEGRTVIQTYQPQHYAIAAAARHDYQMFYERERAIREAFGYPPFCELAVFCAMHHDEALARGAAARFERELRRGLTAPGVTVLPAVPAGIRKIKDQYRYQVVVKYLRWEDVRETVVRAYRTVDERMRALHGLCTLDVNAGRI